MKISGTFYVFAKGTNWLCNTTDSTLVRVLVYLLSFSDYDSGHIVINAGIIAAMSQDLELSAEQINDAISELSMSVLYPLYGVYREADRSPRYVIKEDEYYIDPACFWHGTADGRRTFQRGFSDSVTMRRNTALRERNERETQWLVNPLDDSYREYLDEEYRKKKEKEERRRLAVEKRKKTLAEKRAASEIKQ